MMVEFVPHRHAYDRIGERVTNFQEHRGEPPKQFGSVDFYRTLPFYVTPKGLLMPVQYSDLMKTFQHLWRQVG